MTTFHIIALVLSYLVIGFISGTLTQLVFQVKKVPYSAGDERILLFLLAFFFWPAALPFAFLYVTIAKGLKAWIDWIDTIPIRIEARKSKKLLKSSHIEA